MSQTEAAAHWRRAIHWRAALRLTPLLLVIAASIVLSPALRDIAVDWLDSHSAQSHGLLVVPLMLWLVWRQPAPVTDVAPVRTGIALFICIGAGLLAAVGRLSTIETIVAAVWPLGMLAALWGMFGWAGVRRYIIPVGILYFALPVWVPVRSLLLWPATIWLTPEVLAFTGIQFQANGRFIELNSGIFEIEAACSGTNFVMVAALLATLLAHLWQLRWKQFATLVALAATLAFLANLLRVVAIVMIGEATQMRSALVADHYFFGWCLFAAFFAAFLWWANRRYAPAEVPRPAIDIESIPSEATRPVLAALLVGALGLGPALAAIATHRSSAQFALASRAAVASLPGDDVTQFPRESPLLPRFDGADLELNRLLQSADGATWIYLNAFVDQRLGHELVSDESAYLDTRAEVLQTWEDEACKLCSKAALSRQKVRAANGSLWIVRSGYVVDGKLYEGGLATRVAIAKEMLAGNIALNGAIASATRCNSGDCSDARIRDDAAWTQIVAAIASHHRD